MIPVQAKIIAAIAVLVVTFIAGWQVKGAFVAKRDLAIIEAKNEFIKAYQEGEAHTASIVEARLQELKANEKVIERERVKLVDRPIYSNECLDLDGVFLIERARTGKTDPKQPTNEVPSSK
jgi:hypothetical protein